jgi:hypothetical protein
VKTDAEDVEDIFCKLTARGWTVWWDKRCLESGKDWEEGFCAGLVQSRFFVPVMSPAALKDTPELVEDSPCDNVILEYKLAMELKARKLIEDVIPVFVKPFEAKSVGSDHVVSRARV